MNTPTVMSTRQMLHSHFAFTGVDNLCYYYFLVYNDWSAQIRPRHAVAEGPTLATCTWTHNLQVVRSCSQLSRRHGAALSALPTRRYPACRCNLAPSSAVDIFVRPGSSGYETNYDWRPSFRRRGTSSMEQSSSVRHRLLVSWHLPKISHLKTYLFSLLF